MSTRTLKKESVDCAGGLCGLSHCKGHTVEIRYNLTSDTTSIHVDNEHWVTFGDPIWSAVMDLEEEYVKENKKNPLSERLTKKEQMEALGPGPCPAGPEGKEGEPGMNW